jgi:oligopeptide/dipeptide ABC transporter ATP-binding protein
MLEVVNLRREFRVGKQWWNRRRLVAVDGVSLTVPKATTVAVVGESGSGKSTLGRCIVRLLEPTSGQVCLDGVDVIALSRSEYRPYQRKLQMVFQDPGDSLNPRMTAGDTLAEPLRIWRNLSGDALREEVLDLMDRVQLDPAMAGSYPHQLSGGQQQRVGIARALAADPELVVLDEPTSALDVSVQAQILNLLVDLQDSTRTSYLLISHDLWTVRYLAQEIVVLYLGRVMERGPVDAVFADPRHPYTRSLLSAAPKLAQRVRTNGFILMGEVGNPLDVGPGCPLAPRCPLAQTDCAHVPQRLIDVAPHHAIACNVVTGADLAIQEERRTG